MGNLLWKRRNAGSVDYQSEPRVCSWELRGSWVDVSGDNIIEHVDENDSVVTVKILQNKDLLPAMQRATEAAGLSADKIISNSPDTSPVDFPLTDPCNKNDPSIEKEEMKMELGEMTETKKAAIMSTLRKNSSRLCEGVSITCLVAILYSNDVTGSLVFSGLSTAPHKTNYLVQEILTAVEEEPQKFEAVCSSLELAHSAEFGQHLWRDYERELEVLEAGGEFLDERAD